MLLDDNLRWLCFCLKEKYLQHLLFSKKRVPKEMVLSPASCMTSLLNFS